jgi:demethylmenaquinone methyltransferase/2-methoxy-6-polyprenyl-1,4-benzoquinol methylase
VLSGRQDVLWRKKVAKLIRGQGPKQVLDLATGTADQILTIFEKVPSVESGVGVDLSEKMLEFGRKKVSAKGLDGKLELKNGDASQIPFPDQSFDAVTISFGIRNVMDVSQSLREMHRVLRPSGRTYILEFSLPAQPLRGAYLFYLRNILPHFGSLLSGDSYAYRYLNETIETFPYGAAFCDLMIKAGFTQVNHYPLTFGIATIYCGEKPKA